ncbi:PIN domain-like protein [Pavlovales sp. CCMP2436]|nr:PIN domain-like protein [Pavlovales sp. CCMP2436]
MGIPGLLPFVDGAKRRIHVSELRGKRVAVDAYVWLHRGARSCASELGMGVETDKFTEYSMEMIRMFRSHDVEPVLVFDGSYFPCKAPTEEKRALARSNKRSHAEYLQCAGASAQETSDAFYAAIDITPEIARALQLRLKREGVEFIIAPFEADVQLAYLCLSGVVHCVCTEDSDILVYQCPRVLYKLDRTGYADWFEFEELKELADGARPLFAPWPLWRESQFTNMCILAGCDYLANPKKVAIKGAHQLCLQYTSDRDLLRVLQMRGHIGTTSKESAEYVRCFRTAQLIFSYAPVYDPLTKSIRRLCTEDPRSVKAELRPYLDVDVPLPAWSADLVHAICVAGEVNPITLELFADARPLAARSAVDSAVDLAVDSAMGFAAGSAAPLPDLAQILRKRRLDDLTGAAARGPALNSTAAARAGFVNPARSISAPQQLLEVGKENDLGRKLTFASDCVGLHLPAPVTLAAPRGQPLPFSQE